ncbi:MAG: hypothetical protein FD131_2259 [Rhodocyclaceae bacterium]|nr:MAG: hypothetical protein FD131_2259 [Rhodocyclaceae bacterium]
MSNFDVIESLFSELAIAAGSELSESERAEIQSFIDVGEYGVALETAVDIYAEEKKIPSAEVVTLIEKLALEMSMEPESVLRRFAA